MSLFYRILIRLSLGIIFVLTGWAIVFYIAMIDEINDEVDDSLEDYSEVIIIRSLAGEQLPSKDSGSNNQYFLTEVTEEYANNHEDIRYQDSMIYIPEKDEKEPARILTTIFRDDEGVFHELTVSTPSIEKGDLKDAILHLIISLYIILLLIIIIINIWVFRKSMKPLYVLLGWLNNYRLGIKNMPLHNPTDVREFQKLNDSIVRFAARSEDLFEQQKQFIGNASHELQTPLAICRNRVEMLLEDESLSVSQMEELVNIHRTLERVTKQNKSLLLLSKIDNGRFVDTTLVDMNSVLGQYLEDYQEVYEYKNITLTVTEEGIFKIEISESLAATLVTNLVKNAYVHNVMDGCINIVMRKHEMVFCNTGTSAPLDKNHIFERFYQGNKKEGSTGLGLAIVSSICKQYDLHIEYSFCNGLHCFSVKQK